jgi:Putative 2OG-Fe(II) oxygenase
MAPYQPNYLVTCILFPIPWTLYPAFDRLTVTEIKKSFLSKTNLDICDYIEIPPEEGMMILLPSWLQHSVIPLSVKSRFKKKNEGARISLAFNFNQA